MIIKVRIKTPKGQAKATDWKIRRFLLPLGSNPQTKVNKEDSQITWTIECDARRYMKITRNVNMFDVTMRNIMQSKSFKWQARRKVGEEGIKELDKMLLSQTSVEIVKDDIDG